MQSVRNGEGDPELYQLLRSVNARGFLSIGEVGFVETSPGASSTSADEDLICSNGRPSRSSEECLPITMERQFFLHGI